MVTERAQQRYDDKRQHRATRCNVSKAVPLPGGTVDNHRHHANRDTQRKGIQYDFRDADRTLRNNRQSVASKRNCWGASTIPCHWGSNYRDDDKNIAGKDT